jgi:hypothetical protein
MSDRELLAALDACRPGESDMDDPALGDVARRLEHDSEALRLRERVAAADRRLEAALHAVEPPVGLADRLLARLSTTGNFEPTQAASTQDSAVASAPAKRAPLGRRMFVAGSLAAVAAAVLVAINLWPEPPDPWTGDQVLEAAIGLYTRGARTPARPLADHPSKYPPSRDVVKLPPATQWWRLDDALADSNAVVYEIELGRIEQGRGGPRGWLFAVSPSAGVTGLPDAAPVNPATPTTQGVCAAAWKEGDLVYVLVVEGGPVEYRQFLRSAGGVIASNRSANQSQNPWFGRETGHNNRFTQG